jgi:hypothetical protein
MANKPRKRGKKSGGPDKAPETDGMLTNAARAIGTALGNLSAKAKAIELPKPPTFEEAKASLASLSSKFRKKKPAPAKPRKRTKKSKAK